MESLKHYILNSATIRLSVTFPWNWNIMDIFYWNTDVMCHSCRLTQTETRRVEEIRVLLYPMHNQYLHKANLYARLKNGTYYGNTGGRRRPQGFRSLGQRVFIRSLSNLVNMLVGTIYWPSSITSQIPQALLNYGPWIVKNCPNLGFPLSKLKSFDPVFIKLGECVGGHNISIKFYNKESGNPNFGQFWTIQGP